MAFTNFIISFIILEFNWKKVINIERTKAFQRYLSSKKATFEVFHYKGFLRKAISLGKATFKLEQLLNKAEIHHVLDVCDNDFILIY